MDANQTVVVTGAAGFIGRRVVRRLREAGWSVVGLDDRSGKASVNRALQVDIADRAQMARAFGGLGVRRIVHLASVLPTAAKLDPKRATEVNIAGSLNVLEMARTFQVERVVQASSISVYGTQPGLKAVSETDAVAPIDLYGTAKRYVEVLGEAYERIYGVGFAALRIATVIGAGAVATGSPWRSQIFEALRTAEQVELTIPYRASEVLPLVHVEDVAEMLVVMVTAKEISGGIYNSPAESVRVGELKQWVEAVNPRIRVELGEQEVSGFPSVVDGKRFDAEFAFKRRSIQERLSE